MSVSLTLLPPELVCCVVSNISSKSTLCNLARCSRKLYLCVVPHLYRRVQIKEGIGNGEQQDGRLRSIASLLIQRPDLARLVRHFTLHVEEGTRTERVYFEERKSEGHLNPEMVKVDQAFALSKEEKINCLGQLSLNHRPHHDFILALLLPILPKVEILILSLGSSIFEKNSYDTYHLEQMIQRAARTKEAFSFQPPLEALTVFFHSHGLSNVRSTGFIASILKLPAIHRVYGGFKSTRNDDLNGFGVADKSLRELDKSSSPLTFLDLFDYGLSIADLGCILQSPKALKVFLYTLCPSASSKLTDIRHALGPQERCLKSLDLDCCDKFFYKNRDLEPMPSFITFSTLKVFKIRASFLLKTDNGIGRHSLIDIFPPSLETLHLTSFHPLFASLLEALKHLLAQKSPQQIPSFKKLILEEDGIVESSLYVRLGRVQDAPWNDEQETAIWRLGRLAAAQHVSVHVKRLERARVGNE
ncbi:hypothetical protein MMC22_001180 [Lobaria immixta]|nr:hypothetical protein [Lobaria immixta]